jgi:Sensors of blue-light using FAD
MISLTYLSSSSRELDEAELEQILGSSRRNNAAAGLSGMLLYAEGHFIQTLEGDAEAVDAAFDRIQNDTRHRNVMITLREEIPERRFADWSMGFRRLTTEETADIPGFTDYLDPHSELYANTKALGNAGIFHRVFRDNMRL